MRPLQAYAVTVQQNAAGVRGVPEILLSVPQEWGIKGVERRSRDSIRGVRLGVELGLDQYQYVCRFSSIVVETRIRWRQGLTFVTIGV
jgi:hypothetical protein